MNSQFWATVHYLLASDLCTDGMGEEYKKLSEKSLILLQNHNILQRGTSNQKDIKS